MNEKRPSVKELIAAYNREKDSDVVKRLMLVILVERDGIQRTKLGEMERQGLSPGLPVFHADRGYDSNYNCQILFEMGIIPNIKQRGGAVNRGKPYRSRAAKIFDEEYRQRGMIEGVFGGEESKRHQLRCRFILPDNRRRFGKIRAIT